MLIRIFFALSILLFLFGGLYLTKRYQDAQAGAHFAASGPPPARVAVASATTGKLARILEAIGSLEAVRQVIVAPEVGGRIVTIHFEPGTPVRAGDRLVQLNDAPERGELERSRAAAKLAERELTRLQSVTDSRAVSRLDVEAAESRLEQARGDITRIEALIAQKLVLAPFTGVLGLRKVHLGQYLQPGQSIVSLTDLEVLYLNFTLPEQTFRQLVVGQSVELHIDAFPDRVFEGTITTIEPQVIVETRTITVQATLTNHEHLLRPGMFATVQVMLPPEENIVTVPETAVDKTMYGDSLFVVRQRGLNATTQQPQYAVERLFVKTGRRANGRIAVLDGVTPGDLVVTSGQVNLTSGAPVTIAQVDTLADKTTGAQTESDSTREGKRHELH
jgi:multidrug efflux system membrane fusion protein